MQVHFVLGHSPEWRTYIIQYGNQNQTYKIL